VVLTLRSSKATVSAVVLVLAIGGSAMAGAYEDAMAAKDAGDYANAFKLLQPLAVQGDARSQFQLSLLFGHGQGVPVNLQESVKWLRLAATRGNAPAQSNLGAAYSRGAGVPRDDVRAVTWFTIAAASGSTQALTNRAVALRRMTPAQIRQAQEMAADCIQRSLQACD
jgi:TPR repeat protein